jgi:hypothetical protein
MTTEIVPFHSGVKIATVGGRLDIVALFRHFLAPYAASQPFAGLIEIVKRNGPEARSCRNRRHGAALAITRAVANHADEIREAIEHLSLAMSAPNEENVRGIIGAMMMVYPNATPTETSSYFIDALVMELTEPDDSRWPYSLPAIAAAARECWKTLPAPPSIAEFIRATRKHQSQIEGVMEELGDVLEASDWAEDLIESRAA